MREPLRLATDLFVKALGEDEEIPDPEHIAQCTNFISFHDVNGVELTSPGYSRQPVNIVWVTLDRIQMMQPVTFLPLRTGEEIYFLGIWSAFTGELLRLCSLDGPIVTTGAERIIIDYGMDITGWEEPHQLAARSLYTRIAPKGGVDRGGSRTLEAG